MLLIRDTKICTLWKLNDLLEDAIEKGNERIKHANYKRPAAAFAALEMSGEYYYCCYFRKGKNIAVVLAQTYEYSKFKNCVTDLKLLGWK